jgi:hypothetical protein
VISAAASMVPGHVGLLGLLRIRPCGYLVGVTLVGRLPLGMVPVAVLLHAAGDLAVGGLLAAVYGLAPALGQPMLGRLADRQGLLLPNLVGAAAGAVALTALAVVGVDRLAPALVAAAAAGLCAPPLEGSTRALLQQVLPSRRHVEAAYAVDSSVQEIVYVLGPVLAVVLARTYSPAAALAVAAGLLLVGSSAFALSRSCRTWRPIPRRPDWSGPLRAPTVPAVLLAMILIGGCVGALDVAALAASDRHAVVWLAGALPAIFSLAGLIGGLAYCRVSRCSPRLRRLAALGGGFAVCWLPLATDPPPAAALACVVLPGLVFVPLLTEASLHLTDRAPAGTTAEVVGWLGSSIRGGLAGGTAAAGAMAGHLLLPAAAATIGAAALTVTASLAAPFPRSPALAATGARIPERSP